MLLADLIELEEKYSSSQNITGPAKNLDANSETSPAISRKLMDLIRTYKESTTKEELTLLKNLHNYGVPENLTVLKPNYSVLTPIQVDQFNFLTPRQVVEKSSKNSSPTSLESGLDENNNPKDNLSQQNSAESQVSTKNSTPNSQNLSSSDSSSWWSRQKYKFSSPESAVIYEIPDDSAPSKDVANLSAPQLNNFEFGQEFDEFYQADWIGLKKDLNLNLNAGNLDPDLRDRNNSDFSGASGYQRQNSAGTSQNQISGPHHPKSPNPSGGFTNAHSAPHFSQQISHENDRVGHHSNSQSPKYCGMDGFYIDSHQAEKSLVGQMFDNPNYANLKQVIQTDFEKKPEILLEILTGEKNAAGESAETGHAKTSTSPTDKNIQNPNFLFHPERKIFINYVLNYHKIASPDQEKSRWDLGKSLHHLAYLHHKIMKHFCVILLVEYLRFLKVRKNLLKWKRREKNFNAGGF